MHIVTDRQQYELSPAHEVLSCGLARGFQQMRVGRQEGDSTLDNALSMSELFSLKRDDAAGVTRMIACVVNAWKEHFQACGVTSGDIEQYAPQIDRPFLKDQRDGVRTASSRG